jgi:outer membrane protein assembly factor BamB
MRHHRLLLTLTLYVVTSLATRSFAEQWPQFLGPDRTGVSQETIPLIDAFPGGGPKVVWKVPGGVGMSGLAVTTELCITLAHRDGKQSLVALDRTTGAERWVSPLAAAYKNAMGDGSRATPTVHQGSIYSYTGEGVLTCSELATGKPVWQRNLTMDLNCTPSEYGLSSSPLVIGNAVVVHVGADQATVLAADTATGKTLWTAGKGRAGYSSPANFTIHGQSQVVAFVGSECLGIEPNTGKVIWQYPYATDYDCNTASPVQINNQVLLSSGENHGSVLLKISEDGGVQVVWQSQGTGSALRSEWQTPVITGNLLFGFDNVGGAGPITNLVCMEANTGKTIWKQMRFGKSNGILADGKLLISTLEGELVMVRATADGFQELARAKVMGKTRQAPALSKGFVFLRDDENIICIDLRKS